MTEYLDERVIEPFRHQRQFMTSPWVYKEVDDFFLIGGYGCGKSFSIVLLILNIVRVYNGHQITVGLGSVTISLFRKTIWQDLERLLKMSGTVYSFDRQQNTIRIGTITFQIVPLENPGDVFAYNFSIFIADEVDELPQDKAILVFTAIHERTRVRLPDGRGSFACFATTAQGYKGCYQIVQKLIKDKSDHIIIRGHTKDNTSLTSKYLKNLYSLYNENERKAYLEGAFINLATGRVYGDFDEGLNCWDHFDVIPDDTILVGQDKNIGFNKGVALVKRGKMLFVIRDFNFKSIAEAPSTMRNAYPLNRIIWYPDASADEIFQLYSKEIRENGIEVRMSRQNPSVIERTFIVNKLFKTKRMAILNNDDTLNIRMALKIRQFDELGKPAKGRGENSPDHITDALDYVAFQSVASDVDFIDIFEVAKKMNQSQKIRITSSAA